MHPQRTLAHACLGRTVADIRAYRGLTQQQLAARVHVNQRYIAALERGSHNPPFDRLLHLAAGLGVPLDDLFIRYQAHFEAYPGRPEGLEVA